MPISTTPVDCVNPGKDMTLYYNTGSCAVPVWVEHLGVVGDLQLEDTDDEEEVSRRRSAYNIKEFSPGMQTVSISGQQITDFNYQGNRYINASKKGGSPQDFLILTSPLTVVNAYGYRGKFYNFVRSVSGPMQGEQEQTFNLKPAACADCHVRAVLVSVSGTAADFDLTSLT